MIIITNQSPKRRNSILFLFLSAYLISLGGCNPKTTSEYRKITVTEYRDKLKAGWLGQIAGVSWGGPTEFRWKDAIIPEENMPQWAPEMINEAFGQDDIYVEMTFLRTLEEHGLDASIRQMGIDFANSEYPLWCANDAGRKNLRAGIAPPDCSNPAFTKCPNDIDYQIESDFSGLIAPGMPAIPIELGEKFGRLMNYSDGMYAGQFIGGMYTEAFFEDDLFKIIDAGLSCIPEGCQYAEMIRDVVAWYKTNPDDWEATWQLCQKKYREDPEYQKCSNGGIDVKINGAYILIGLLYGKKDLDQTIIISTRCGQDSDCNPSNAAGILFTTLGASKLPPRYTEKLDQETVFSHTTYNFPKLIDVCEKLAREYIVREGGRIEKDANGEEIFLIPIKKPIPSPLVFSWDPEPIANSRFTEEEMAKIKHKDFLNIQTALDNLFPGWTISNCGTDMNPGFIESFRGKQNVIMTHPLDKETPCVLTTTIDIPKSEKSLLKLLVSYHNKGDWDLIVRINGSEQKKITVGEETVGIGKDGWLEVTYDLTPFAGNNNVKIDLENKANGWAWEAGYWGEIKIEN
ncbi:ADP-ribosylglycohydrolase family protein [Proteiniphilum sp.]|uniref:ADP-ribosylglycohydrolase family protein n=1 Tax=Proteiniphilum sp. TaxID=1926877 RepID=UPI002B202256|nr:ADP-ribosylglycohydrolase family protein [Proteiniphilum sp.]MEA4917955.1 ADP-ribosylglycohydrolase family protein [Proteiniphilum sp.]